MGRIAMERYLLLALANRTLAPKPGRVGGDKGGDPVSLPFKRIIELSGNEFRL